MSLTTNLPDGWHVVPGDGTKGDPNRRLNGYYENEFRGRDRYLHWAHVVNGVIDALRGQIEKFISPTSLPSKWDIEYLSEAEKNWKVSIKELIDPETEVDEWSDQYEVEL